MKISRHQELDVYKKAFEAAMEVFELSKAFPKEETYSLTDQIRRSSRSVASNIAEAWRKRRYEAAETQTWIEFSVRCGYLERATAVKLYKEYDEIIGMIVSMIVHSEKWVMPTGLRAVRSK